MKKYLRFAMVGLIIILCIVLCIYIVITWNAYDRGVYFSSHSALKTFGHFDEAKFDYRDKNVHIEIDNDGVIRSAKKSLLWVRNDYTLCAEQSKIQLIQSGDTVYIFGIYDMPGAAKICLERDHQVYGDVFQKIENRSDFNRLYFCIKASAKDVLFANLCLLDDNNVILTSDVWAFKSYNILEYNDVDQLSFYVNKNTQNNIDTAFWNDFDLIKSKSQIMQPDIPDGYFVKAIACKSIIKYSFSLGKNNKVICHKYYETVSFDFFEKHVMCISKVCVDDYVLNDMNTYYYVDVDNELMLDKLL